MITTMKKENKRLAIIIASVFALLAIPALGMQFSSEVNWGPGDFVIMGMLLLGTGMFIELILRTVKKKSLRLPLIILMIILFLLTWAELGVGIFGTPFAGD